MSEQYPVDALMRAAPRSCCEWGGSEGMADGAPQCIERPTYRCVVTGPDDVGDLCAEHVVRMTTAINQMAEDMPWIGTVIVMPLEP